MRPDVIALRDLDACARLRAIYGEEFSPAHREEWPAMPVCASAINVLRLRFAQPRPIEINAYRAGRVTLAARGGGDALRVIRQPGLQDADGTALVSISIGRRP
jgi:hypothetical protein